MRVSRCGWVLGVALVIATGCGSESGGGPDSLSALGIDDGASAGLSTSALVTKGKEAEMTLETGAGVKIPRGAVEGDVTLGLKRPADKEALVLIKRLDGKRSAVSAPYVVTPHGTKFNAELEVTLPIGKSADPRKLKVLWLEDEKDTKWKELGLPEVSGEKATIKLDHFSVLLLVEDASRGVVDGSDAGTGSAEDDAGGGSTERDSGEVLADDAGGGIEQDSGVDPVEVDAGTIGVLPDSGPGDAVLSALPIDLAADCPASGCTVTFSPMEDGTWLECAVLGETANFDPETFDFAEACAGAQPNPYNLTFVYDGVTKIWEPEWGYCEARTTAIDATGTRLFKSECADTYGVVKVESNSIRTADGTLYAYDLDDCGGTCSGSLYLKVFQPGDTSEMNVGCEAEPEKDDATCPVAGVVLPFGPSGVGSLPEALMGTAWLRCDGNASDPLEACSSLVEDPFVNGYLSVLRFNSDDTADDLSYDSAAGWSAMCGVAAGGDAARLRFFWCADPADPDGWGAEQSAWEVQRLGTRDYLLVSESGDPEPDIYVSAPEGLIPRQDPCAAALPLSCVIQ